MAESKPFLQLHEMAPGQKGDIYVLLSERNRGFTRDGKPFFTCKFRDALKSATSMVWADSPYFTECDLYWKEGQFFKVRAIYQEHHQYGSQLELHKIRPVNDGDAELGFDPLFFVECSRFDPEEMFTQLCDIVNEHLQNASLQKLVLTLLERHAPTLKSIPATRRHFYPFHGGLLEHILSVTRNCLLLVEKYAAHYPTLEPPLNKDLVIAAAILHDIGRLFVYDDQITTLEATIPGKLLGHQILGRDLIRETARELGDIDPEILLLLEHLVISHLQYPEWGAPRTPLIPECLILHYADDLDARMEMYARCLQRDQEDGPFTARNPILGKQLLKGRKL